MPVGREHLVAGEDEEVAVERLHVDRMCDTACAPSTSTTRAVAVRHLDHLLRRRDRAERVRHLREGDELACAGRAASRTRRGAPGRGRRPARRAAGRPSRRTACCQGTMLAWCSSQVMTISSPAPTLRRPQLWATRLMPRSRRGRRRSRRRERRVEEAPHLLAGGLVGVGRARRQRRARRGGCSSSRARRSTASRSMTACGFCVVAALSSQTSGRPLTRSRRIGKSRRTASASNPPMAAVRGSRCWRRRSLARRSGGHPGSRRTA